MALTFLFGTLHYLLSVKDVIVTKGSIIEQKEDFKAAQENLAKMPAWVGR